MKNEGKEEQKRDSVFQPLSFPSVKEMTKENALISDFETRTQQIPRSAKKQRRELGKPTQSSTRGIVSSKIKSTLLHRAHISVFVSFTCSAQSLLSRSPPLFPPHVLPFYKTNRHPRGSFPLLYLDFDTFPAALKIRNQNPAAPFRTRYFFL